MSSILAQMRVERGGWVSQPMSTAVHNAHGAQINFGDLTPYLTYGFEFFVICSFFYSLLEMNYSMIRRNSSVIVIDLLSKESPKGDGSEPRTWDL
jgi:hypothetical protein